MTTILTSDVTLLLCWRWKKKCPLCVLTRGPHAQKKQGEQKRQHSRLWHLHSRPLLAPRPLRWTPPLRRATSFSPPFSRFSFPSSPASTWLDSFCPDTLFFFPTISQESWEGTTHLNWDTLLSSVTDNFAQSWGTEKNNSDVKTLKSKSINVIINTYYPKNVNALRLNVRLYTKKLIFNSKG